MLDKAAGAQSNAVHGALNYRRRRLAVVAVAFAPGALQGGQKIRIGINPAPKRSTLQVQAQGNDQRTDPEHRQGGT